MSTRRRPLQNVSLDRSKSPHAGLWLDKFIPEQDRNKKEVRSSFVGDVASIQSSASYSIFFERWKKSLEDLKNSGCAVDFRMAKAQGRLLIGTGNESVLETAVTLHRTYGVPYIPGSALKGLAADVARKYCGAHWSKDSDAYGLVFGQPDASGCITFFDALPEPNIGSKFLHADVLTVHHKEYYQLSSSTPPADWDDPNPVPFLSATGRYLVALAVSSDGEPWLDVVFQILKTALAEIGVGAKTSSGYGRMTLV